VSAVPSPFPEKRLSAVTCGNGACVASGAVMCIEVLHGKNPDSQNSLFYSFYDGKKKKCFKRLSISA
jgi:hypothetical protein